MAQVRDPSLVPSLRSGLRLRMTGKQPKINAIDGLRLEFADSWMLIRPSGTEPALRVIAESMSKAQTDKLIEKGTEMVQSLLLSSPLTGED